MRILLLLLSVAALVGCNNGGSVVEDSKTRDSITRVRTVSIQKSEWPATFDRSGTVQARTSTVISSRVPGYIRELRVAVGDRVQAGQVLAILDARDLDAQRRAAIAAREESNSAAAEAETSIASARANLALAETTHKRMAGLFAKTSISDQEMDESAAKLSVAKAALEAATARRAQIQSRIAQANEAVRSAEIVTGYTRITAPYAGIIIDKPAQPGALASPGSPLLTLEKQDSYRIEVPVEQSRISSLRSGQPVTIMLKDAGDRIPGHIGEIVPALDPVSNTFLVKIDIAPRPYIRSGMFARVEFSAGSEAVLAIPVAAISNRGDLPSAFVVENGVARLRLLTLGRTRDNAREVLSGINPGDIIITPVPASLRDGVRVEAQQ